MIFDRKGELRQKRRKGIVYVFDDMLLVTNQGHRESKKGQQ